MSRSKKYEVASRFVLAIVLFVFALTISVLTNRGFIKQYFPYVSCILLFAVTWILYRSENRSLKDIGLNISFRNLSFFPLGIIIGIFALFGAKFLRALYLSETFHLSTSIDYSTLLFAFYFILPQVATEEFLFRGFLFKKTIEVSNLVMANIVFSIVFMLIHVIDENVLANRGLLIILVISIPIGHLLFATALLKSKTLYFPIGIHLGNNWATRHMITDNNNGDSILFVANSQTFETWTPFIIFLILFNGFYLLVTLVIWKWDKIIEVFYIKTN